MRILRVTTRFKRYPYHRLVVRASHNDGSLRSPDIILAIGTFSFNGMQIKRVQRLVLATELSFGLGGGAMSQ